MKLLLSVLILHSLIGCADLNGMHGYAANYSRCTTEGDSVSCYVVADTDRIFGKRTKQESIDFLINFARKAIVINLRTCSKTVDRRIMETCEFIDDYAMITKHGSNFGPNFRNFTFRFVRRSETQSCREGMDDLHRWFMSRIRQKIKLQNSFEAKSILMVLTGMVLWMWPLR